MIKNKIISILTALFLFMGVNSASAEYTISDEYDVFEQVAGYISTYYIDSTLQDGDIMRMAISEYLREDDERLIEILKSMLLSLDPYSEFFTADEFRGFVDNINRRFYGIGVKIEQREGYVVITGFTSGSAAESAGIKVGDKISAVNGEDMYAKNTNVVRNAIQGELGEPVSITVLRNNEEITYSVKRCEVKEDTVTYLKISDTVAYISVIDMAEKTVDEFAEALENADKDGITNIILDLRNNGGGYLESATEMGMLVVPEGVIVDTSYRQPFMNVTYKSELKNPKYKFNVLVNEYTASAAEILASAIQDSGVGKLVGTKTFGKGVIQGTFNLTNGSVFKLTIGHYITRNGKEINGVGLEPDVVIENEIKPINTSLYTPFTYNKKWKIGDVDDNIKAAKERLYYLGYYTGETDNVFDELLADTISAFQEDSNLYAYGVLDITTQNQLEKEFAKIETLVDTQLNKAYELFTGEKHIPEIQ